MTFIASGNELSCGQRPVSRNRKKKWISKVEICIFDGVRIVVANPETQRETSLQKLPPVDTGLIGGLHVCYLLAVLHY